MSKFSQNSQTIRPVMDEPCTRNLKELAKGLSSEGKIFINWLMKGKSQQPYCLDVSEMAKQAMNEEKALKKSKKVKAFSPSNSSSKIKSEANIVEQEALETKDASKNLELVHESVAEEKAIPQAVQEIQPIVHTLSTPSRVNIEMLQFVADLQKNTIPSSTSLEQAPAINLNLNEQQGISLRSSQNEGVRPTKSFSTTIHGYKDPICLTLKTKPSNLKQYQTLIQVPELREYTTGSRYISKNTVDIQGLMFSVALILGSRKILRKVLKKANVGKSITKILMNFRRKARNFLGFGTNLITRLSHVFTRIGKLLQEYGDLYLFELYSGNNGDWLANHEYWANKEKAFNLNGGKGKTFSKGFFLGVIFHIVLTNLTKGLTYAKTIKRKSWALVKRQNKKQKTSYNADWELSLSQAFREQSPAWIEFDKECLDHQLKLFLQSTDSILYPHRNKKRSFLGSFYFKHKITIASFNFAIIVSIIGYVIGEIVGLFKKLEEIRQYCTTNTDLSIYKHNMPCWAWRGNREMWKRFITSNYPGAEELRLALPSLFAKWFWNLVVPGCLAIFVVVIFLFREYLVMELHNIKKEIKECINRFKQRVKDFKDFILSLLFTIKNFICLPLFKKLLIIFGCLLFVTFFLSMGLAFLG